MRITKPTIQHKEEVFDLLKAVEVHSHQDVTLNEFAIANSRCLKYGFILDPSIIAEYKDLDDIIAMVKTKLGLSNQQLNHTLFKSWDKVEQASWIQLVFEQLWHYYQHCTPDNRTAGPNNISALEDVGYSVNTIKGMTRDEIRAGVLTLCQVAVKNPDPIATLVPYLNISIDEIANREVKCILADKTGIMPLDPTEYLRVVCYKATGKSLLIKNKETIDAIKQMPNIPRYSGSIEKIAEVFNRFKPLFLAMRTSAPMRPWVNEVSRASKTHHVPMTQNPLNELTWNKKVKIPENPSITHLIRALHAVRYRMAQGDIPIVYKIRNGKSYTTTTEGKDLAAQEKEILKAIKSTHSLKGTKVYIPSNVTYAAATTEKQFVGNIPAGSYVSGEQLTFGVYWENLDGQRVDLDLKCLSMYGAVGWDASYRNDELLFSGDITDANPGAMELFTAKYLQNPYLITLNHYNRVNQDDVIPFKIVVAKHNRFNTRGMIAPSEMILITPSELKEQGVNIGLVTRVEKEVRFYIDQFQGDQTISSRNNELTTLRRAYLLRNTETKPTLNEVLKLLGASFVDSPEKSDVDLSPSEINKATIFSLLGI